jgi:hypothetical protein
MVEEPDNGILSMPQMTPIYHIRGLLALQTRLGADIENYFDTRPLDPGRTIASDALKQQFRSAIHITRPSARYNCHGLTFASRRTSIEDPKEVEKILAHDGYAEIERTNVKPGDIAVYYRSSQIDHSGLVVTTNDFGRISILSKWGELHEAIHQPHDCPYDASNIRFFRTQ